MYQIKVNGVLMPTIYYHLSEAIEACEAGLTEQILAQAKLDFVIKMPNNLFSEQKRTVNTSIFGFTKTPHSIQDDVLFYNLENDGLISIQHKGRIDKNNCWENKKKAYS